MFPNLSQTPFLKNSEVSHEQGKLQKDLESPL